MNNIYVTQVTVSMLISVLSIFIKIDKLRQIIFSYTIFLITFSLYSLLFEYSDFANVDLWSIFSLKKSTSYTFGAWDAPFGIEWRLDLFNKFIFIINTLIFCLFVFFKTNTNEKISLLIYVGILIFYGVFFKYIKITTILLIILLYNLTYFVAQFFSNKINDIKKVPTTALEYANLSSKGILDGRLEYFILFMSYCGFSGMILSNDLFNIYIFLEIASISNCILIAIDSRADSKKYISAIDYLIFNSVSASLILIGIGIIFSITGSFNITDIKSIIHIASQIRIFNLGIIFFIIGILSKIGIFPFYVWSFRSYRYISSHLLSYLAPTTEILVYYIFIRFIYFFLNPELGHLYFINVGIAVSIISITCGSYRAFVSKTIKENIIFSGIVQVGYCAIVMLHKEFISIVPMFIINNVMMKIAFFSFLETANDQLLASNKMNQSQYNTLVFITFITLVLINTSIPFTCGFVNKITLFAYLLQNKKYLLFCILILLSLASIKYNYNLLILFWKERYKYQLSIKSIITLAISFITIYFYTLIHL